MRQSDLAVVSRVRRDLLSGAARANRMAAGVSCAAVGRTLGVSRASVSEWEIGRASPTDEHALAYGRLLDRLTRQGAA